MLLSNESWKILHDRLSSNIFTYSLVCLSICVSICLSDLSWLHQKKALKCDITSSCHHLNIFKILIIFLHFSYDFSVNRNFESIKGGKKKKII